MENQYIFYKIPYQTLEAVEYPGCQVGSEKQWIQWFLKTYEYWNIVLLETKQLKVLDLIYSGFNDACTLRFLLSNEKFKNKL